MGAQMGYEWMIKSAQTLPSPISKFSSNATSEVT